MLGYSFCTAERIGAFCQLLLPLKAPKIICTKAVLLWFKNVGEMSEFHQPICAMHKSGSIK
jgi:hypothetical protein